ncbi:hypothetical protein Tco_1378069 [Tanacetum coccineum]
MIKDEIKFVLQTITHLLLVHLRILRQFILQAFRHWCAAPLSTLYPPTTSDSSSGDSLERPLHSSSHSVGPSRKRCRSSVDSVPLSTSVIGSLAPTRADLLPPRKRFKDSYSFEASIEEDTEIDPIETKVDMELGIGVRDDIRDHVKIDPRDVRDDTEEYEADTNAGDKVEGSCEQPSSSYVPFTGGFHQIRKDCDDTRGRDLGEALAAQEATRADGVLEGALGALGDDS